MVDQEGSPKIKKYLIQNVNYKTKSSKLYIIQSNNNYLTKNFLFKALSFKRNACRKSMIIREVPGSTDLNSSWKSQYDLKVNIVYISSIMIIVIKLTN